MHLDSDAAARLCALPRALRDHVLLGTALPQGEGLARGKGNRKRARRRSPSPRAPSPCAPLATGPVLYGRFARSAWREGPVAARHAESWIVHAPEFEAWLDEERDWRATMVRKDGREFTLLSIVEDVKEGTPVGKASRDARGARGFARFLALDDRGRLRRVREEDVRAAKRGGRWRYDDGTARSGVGGSWSAVECPRAPPWKKHDVESSVQPSLDLA